MRIRNTGLLEFYFIQSPWIPTLSCVVYKSRIWNEESFVSAFREPQGSALVCSFGYGPGIALGKLFRVRIQVSKWNRIHADPDPDPKHRF
jgi:hypothetical protein